MASTFLQHQPMPAPSRHERPRPAGDDRVFGVILRARGRPHPLRDPVDAGDVDLLVAPGALRLLGVLPGRPAVALAVYADADADGTAVPHNPSATALRPGSRPVYGDVVVTAADGAALPAHVVDALVRPRTHR